VTRRALLGPAFVGVALLGAGPSHAGDVALGADLWSSRVWRGITLNPGPVIQPHLAVEGLRLAGRPFAVRVLANYDVGNDATGLATSNLSEIDIEAQLDLSGGLSLSYAELTSPGQLVRRGFESTRELTLAWRAKGPIDATATLHYDLDAVRDYFFEAALGHTFPLSEKSGLSLRAEAGQCGRPFARRYGGGRGGFFQYDLKAGISYRATDRVGLTATVAYAGTFHQALPKQGVGFYSGVGATVYY
jgi:hypothetical protein